MKVKVEVEGMEGSGYRLGAYRALEWVWRLLHRYSESKEGLEKARREVLREISRMARGGQTNLNDESETAADTEITN